MMSDTLLMHVAASDYNRLGQALERMRVGVSASELHGSLTGYLCAGATPGEPWLASLQLEAEGGSADDRALLQHLLAASRAELAGSGAPFEPLLPATVAARSERLQALVEWCRGFLGGLGLGGIGDLRSRSSVAADVLGDFSRIAAGGLALTDGDSDSDDAALADLREFVRDGVRLLRAQSAPPGADGTTPGA